MPRAASGAHGVGVKSGKKDRYILPQKYSRGIKLWAKFGPGTPKLFSSLPQNSFFVLSMVVWGIRVVLFRVNLGGSCYIYERVGDLATS